MIAREAEGGFQHIVSVKRGILVFYNETPRSDPQCGHSTGRRTSEPIKNYRKYNQFFKAPISLNDHHTPHQMQVGLDAPSRHSLVLPVTVVVLNSIRMFLTKKCVYSIALTTFLM